MKKFQIGLLLDDRWSSKYVYELTQWAQQQSQLEISHLIITAPQKRAGFENLLDIAKASKLHQGISKAIFRLVTSIDSVFLKFSPLHRHHFDKFDLGNLVASQITLHPTLANDAVTCQFSQFDVRRVKALELDLLIQCGSCRLEGEIFHAARLGMISFINGFDQFHLPDQAFFWECYNKAPKTGFVIRTLTDEPGQSEILAHGFFATKYCFSLNQANMYKKSSPHFHELLGRIATTGKLGHVECHVQNDEQPCRTPKVRESLSYLFKVIYRGSIKIGYRCVNLDKKWGLSFVQSNWTQVNLCLRTDAIAPKGHFWADPFICAHDGRTYCFVEDYVYKSRLGHIAVLEVTNGSAVHLGDCIKEPFHLSFPFLFRYKGDLYMCPEASASRQIRVYRCVDFPLQWELSSILMDDVSAADSMLFEHAGLWWMLTSIDKSGSDDYTSELYLFYADSPLTKAWTAHPVNPVRIESEGGRTAGLILEKGTIFRLAQRQGYDQYGKGLLMFEVVQLTKTVYEERLLSPINPSLRKGQIGIHHLTTTGAVTVFDHVSRRFSP